MLNNNCFRTNRVPLGLMKAMIEEGTHYTVHIIAQLKMFQSRKKVDYFSALVRILFSEAFCSYADIIIHWFMWYPIIFRTSLDESDPRDRSRSHYAAALTRVTFLRIGFTCYFQHLLSPFCHWHVTFYKSYAPGNRDFLP